MKRIICILICLCLMCNICFSLDQIIKDYEGKYCYIVYLQPYRSFGQNKESVVNTYCKVDAVAAEYVYIKRLNKHSEYTIGVPISRIKNLKLLNVPNLSKEKNENT